MSQAAENVPVWTSSTFGVDDKNAEMKPDKWKVSSKFDFIILPHAFIFLSLLGFYQKLCFDTTLSLYIAFV